MKKISEIVSQLSRPARACYLYGEQFIDHRVRFNLTKSVLHTREHSKRVLLYALIMGEQRLGAQNDVLHPLMHSAVFHDTRRRDDGLDRGHGARAARYYRTFCPTGDLKFYDSAFHIMQYHDQDDALGIRELQHNGADSLNVDLYQIFKDADALDRFRLGPNGLDVRFLRNPEAIALIPLAKDLVKSANGMGNGFG